MADVPASIGAGACMGVAIAAVSAASGPGYVVHGAQISCSCGLRQSRVVVPISHGCYIHDIAQLTVMDFLPMVNIQIFGGCTSPENPSVQVAAAAVVKKVNSKPKGFFEKVVSFFCGSSNEEADASFTSQCAGACTPIIVAPWMSGKGTVKLNGQKPLLQTDTLTCMYAGAIKLETTGQPV